MNNRFDELLPWYVNGSLAAEEREWVDHYLATHPEAHAELDWHRSLSERIQEGAPAVPATLGLAKAMTRVGASRGTPAQRIAAWFGTLGMRPPAAFAALAIFAIQGAVILNLLHAERSDVVEVRATKATVTNEQPMLKINFAPDAKESEIRHLLMSVQGRLAGGPGQLGDYFVIVPAGKEAALADTLKANAIVQAVSLAPGLPSRD